MGRPNRTPRTKFAHRIQYLASFRCCHSSLRCQHSPPVQVIALFSPLQPPELSLHLRWSHRGSYMLVWKQLQNSNRPRWSLASMKTTFTQTQLILTYCRKTSLCHHSMPGLCAIRQSDEAFGSQWGSINITTVKFCLKAVVFSAWSTWAFQTFWRTRVRLYGITL